MSIFSRAFWRELRFTGLLLALLCLLGVKRCAELAPVPATCSAPVAPVAVVPVALRPAGDTSTSANPNLSRKANPRSRWHSLPVENGYLVYPRPGGYRPAPLTVEQARAAQLHKI